MENKLRVHDWMDSLFTDKLCPICILASSDINHPNTEVIWNPSVIMFFNPTINWASSWDYGTYHIGDQRRLRRACASAQSRQSLRCSHSWSMEVDEESEKKIRHLVPLDSCACAFDEKCHNLMSWLNYLIISPNFNQLIMTKWPNFVHVSYGQCILAFYKFLSCVQKQKTGWHILFLLCTANLFVLFTIWGVIVYIKYAKIQTI